MKKFLGLFILLSVLAPSIANSYQSKYPLQLSGSNKPIAVKNQSGKKLYTIEKTGNNEYSTYSIGSHQRTARYKRQKDGTMVFQKYTGH